jgi:hypothetical protein
MSSRFPRIFTWFLAVLFAAISVTGQGLHYFLYQADHLAWHIRPAVATDECPHHWAGHAHHAHEGHSHGDAAHDTADCGKRQHHDHDDCLICRYFTQQQLTPLTADGSVERLAVPFDRAERAAAPLTSEIEPYEARGPPRSPSGIC